MINQRYLHCLYAEDVRIEVAGTYSIIGAFQGGLQVPTMPTTLPKLAVAATLGFAAHDTVKQLRVEVLLDDQVLQSIDTPKEFIEQSVREAQLNDDKERGFFIKLMISIVGIQIEKPCRITTRAYVDNEIWEGNGLKIVLSGSNRNQ